MINSLISVFKNCLKLFRGRLFHHNQYYTVKNRKLYSLGENIFVSIRQYCHYSKTSNKSITTKTKYMHRPSIWVFIIYLLVWSKYLQLFPLPRRLVSGCAPFDTSYKITDCGSLQERQEHTQLSRNFSSSSWSWLQLPTGELVRSGKNYGRLIPSRVILLLRMLNTLSAF